MKLCEQIHKFRCEKKLSQADLADALDVSRQSVSKWETGTAVPELSKLILMSELFEVSLDELVNGSDEKISDTSEWKADDRRDVPYAPQTVHQHREGRVTAGYFLVFFGGLAFLILTALGNFLAGLVFSVPLFLCALICFTCRRRAGLWCAWLIYWFVNIYLHIATGITPSAWVRYVDFEGMNVQTVVSLIMFAAEIGIVTATVICFRKVRFEISRKSVGLLCGGTVWYIVFRLLESLFFMMIAKAVSSSADSVTFRRYSWLMRLTSPMFSVVAVMGITVILIYVVALIRELWARRK
ncbi:MAG: helix-turn-helix transcriptional regulator [Clostridia bacterium]|nr:helix-turn-helix transcriptional regulator [Clostridia bacterium]